MKSRLLNDTKKPDFIMSSFHSEFEGSPYITTII